MKIKGEARWRRESATDIRMTFTKGLTWWVSLALSKMTLHMMNTGQYNNTSCRLERYRITICCQRARATASEVVKASLRYSTRSLKDRKIQLMARTMATWDIRRWEWNHLGGAHLWNMIVCRRWRLIKKRRAGTVDIGKIENMMHHANCGQKIWAIRGWRKGRVRRSRLL